jgi:hypothetical protein
VITILTLILPPQAANIAFMCGLGVLVIVPFAYSYRYFKKQQLNQNS